MNTTRDHPEPNDQDQIDAAEYVLGTFDMLRRHQFEQRMEADSNLKAAVALWSRRFQELADNVPEIEPSARLLEGIQAVVDNTPQPGSETVRDSDGEWQRLFDGVFKKTLLVDDTEGTESYLLRIEPGALVPAHSHAKTEECFVLEGDMVIGTALFEKGDYHAIPANIPHLPITSNNGGVLFIRGEIQIAATA